MYRVHRGTRRWRPTLCLLMFRIVHSSFKVLHLIFKLSFKILHFIFKVLNYMFETIHCVFKILHLIAKVSHYIFKRHLWLCRAQLLKLRHGILFVRTSRLPQCLCAASILDIVSECCIIFPKSCTTCSKHCITVALLLRALA